jgi:hypothetical protein
MPLFPDLFLGWRVMRKGWIGAGFVVFWGDDSGVENGGWGLDMRFCWCF